MITVNDREGFLREVGKLLQESPICVELGVFRGEFSQMIQQLLNPKLLYLIDTFELNEEKRYVDGNYVEYSNQYDYSVVSELFKENILSGDVHIIQSTSMRASFFFPNNYFDLVYIDASHLVEDVIKDLIFYTPKIKNNSLLCGHDYEAVAFPGVKMAVDSFCKQQNFEMIILNKNGGDYALKIK